MNKEYVFNTIIVEHWGFCVNSTAPHRPYWPNSIAPHRPPWPNSTSPHSTTQTGCCSDVKTTTIHLGNEKIWILIFFGKVIILHIIWKVLTTSIGLKFHMGVERDHQGLNFKLRWGRRVVYQMKGLEECVSEFMCLVPYEGVGLGHQVQKSKVLRR